MYIRRLAMAASAVVAVLLVTAIPAFAAPGGVQPVLPSVVPVCPGPAAAGNALCHSLMRTDKGGRNNNTTPSGYGPADLRAAYNIPALSNTGPIPTVAIVDAFDNPNAEKDLAVYRDHFNLPPCTTANGCFKKVNQDGIQGSYPRANIGWAQEISLDLDMVSAICPGCHILLVEAKTNSFANLAKAVDYAASVQGVVAISNSYGGSEFSGETIYEDTYFNHPGIAITVSSGDSGYGVQFPASSQYVTAVGGTTLKAASNSRGWTETAWSSAGSGCSAYIPKPSWQTATADCANRTVADVSAVADPKTGVAVYDSFHAGGWLVFGGTSVGAPIIAAVYALAGNIDTTNYDGSYPYGHTGRLNDVTSGSNGSCGGSYLCTAGTGYDGPTGLGTPNGTGGF